MVKVHIPTKIIEVKTSNPNASLSTIGEQLGVTKQYVSQVLKRAGIEVRRKPTLVRCPYCRNIFGTKNSNQIFCSKGCRTLYNIVDVPCHTCGTIRQLSRAKYNTLQKKQVHFYCSRECTYQGFSLYPGNRVMNARKRGHRVDEQFTQHFVIYCANCGNQKEITQSRYKHNVTKQFFCNKECMRQHSRKE